MNKEWLEDKKKQLNSATIFINENGNEAVEVSLAVLSKLFEQAERVQELESENRILRTVAESNKYIGEQYLEQNQRYREALEAIAYFDDKEEGEVATRIDVKYIARKALEGEE